MRQEHEGEKFLMRDMTSLESGVLIGSKAEQAKITHETSNRRVAVQFGIVGLVLHASASITGRNKPAFLSPDLYSS